jgi:cell division protein FtsL
MAASAAAARQAAPARAPRRVPARAPRRAPARAPRRKGAPRPRARNAAVAGAALLPHAAVGAAGAVRDLSDSSLIMRLTRGRGWIAVLCALLGGIVALNVISLSLNADAGRLGLQIDRLETQNSALRAQVAERLSASRVETAATTLGLANPDPEEISYLSAKDGDAGKLARLLSTGELLTEPSQPSSYPSAGESYGLAPSSPTTDTTTTTPAPSPAPSPPPSTGTSSGESTGTAPSAPSSGTTGGVGL